MNFDPMIYDDGDSGAGEWQIQQFSLNDLDLMPRVDPIVRARLQDAQDNDGKGMRYEHLLVEPLRVASGQTLRLTFKGIEVDGWFSGDDGIFGTDIIVFDADALNQIEGRQERVIYQERKSADPREVSFDLIARYEAVWERKQ